MLGHSISNNDMTYLVPAVACLSSQQEQESCHFILAAPSPTYAAAATIAWRADRASLDCGWLAGWKVVERKEGRGRQVEEKEALIGLIKW